MILRGSLDALAARNGAACGRVVGGIPHRILAAGKLGVFSVLVLLRNSWISQQVRAVIPTFRADRPTLSLRAQ